MSSSIAALLPPIEEAGSGFGRLGSLSLSSLYEYVLVGVITARARYRERSGPGKEVFGRVACEA
jgi:hypothetical protein